MNDELNSGEALFSQKNNNDFSFTLGIICVILLIYNVFLSFFAFIPVSGDSMENTISDGDYCMVQHSWFDVDYGDIVLINTAEEGEKEHIIIKRVIAKAGDRVLFMRTEDNGAVDLYICKSGETSFSVVNEPYINEQMIPDNRNNEHQVFVNTTVAPYNSKVLGSQLSELDRITINSSRVIPDGELYVLGDNRNVSKDSRFYGSFKIDQVMSKVIFII